jgi:hypothetical protein
MSVMLLIDQSAIEVQTRPKNWYHSGGTQVSFLFISAASCTAQLSPELSLGLCIVHSSEFEQVTLNTVLWCVCVCVGGGGALTYMTVLVNVQSGWSVWLGWLQQ